MFRNSKKSLQNINLVVTSVLSVIGQSAVSSAITSPTVFDYFFLRAIASMLRIYSAIALL
ncbi:MAG: hypothetical protein RMY34_03280 [Aulosira sp. DedQUE10]|nr:hypothetical protein [Aulosira sp. DedQUE10]